MIINAINGNGNRLIRVNKDTKKIFSKKNN